MKVTVVEIRRKKHRSRIKTKPAPVIKIPGGYKFFITEGINQESLKTQENHGSVAALDIKHVSIEADGAIANDFTLLKLPGYNFATITS
ncbi:hypothetical protein JYU34_010316 [Plutella xylostella]|uniref:Uncharacterized protein n=1 Tax=Plutella xylostella TaxID=51655 RepID=A0ABQ7QIA0_PLUXY|nr:hypothetical protein JYU34_010316 [Plutella xylostella]